jgi:hypothetical protein
MLTSHKGNTFLNKNFRPTACRVDKLHQCNSRNARFFRLVTVVGMCPNGADEAPGAFGAGVGARAATRVEAPAAPGEMGLNEAVPPHWEVGAGPALLSYWEVRTGPLART